MTNERGEPGAARGPFKMVDKHDLGYEHTLIYGQYRRDLGEFAAFEAKKLKQKDVTDTGKFHKPKKLSRVWYYLGKCIQARDWVFHKVGEEWIYLTLLGILMALLSFTMDYVIEKCQEAKFWLYEELAFSVALQYLTWVLYSVLFILFATGFTHLVSPQAIGSGIPEMKTILRGVVLKEFLTFRTLISKIVGLCSSLGSTLPIGKEGPFVHIASIVATLLGKLSSFRGIYENESRRSEMLAAACAVGVAGTFAAPIGGVLFSIEVTATYFAVRNYWRGFFAAVCGALVFRLLALWFKDEETLTALFKTSLRTEFPFDPLELLAFSFIGVACGFAGALFILLHRKIILFTRKHKKMSSFLQKNRFIYPGLIALVISSCTFPKGLGQFFAGELTHRRAVNELFSNITWTTGQADDIEEEEIISHWYHPATNIYVNLVLFIIMNFWMGALCNTMPIPAGVFVPVFTVGAAFGRLIGESMAAWFPSGIKSGDVIRKIVPGGYAVVGAASLSGSVTRTISTSVIVFELTGQISHVLPAVMAVLISNAIANLFQPSFYDSIIRLKRLPYLPDIISSKSSSWNVYVEDIMVSNLKVISFTSTYGQMKDLLTSAKFRSYPLVDSPESMILLGSVKRFELERMLLLHMNQEQKIFLPNEDDDDGNGGASGRSTPSITPPKEEITPDPPTPAKPRFTVTKVVEDKKPSSRRSSIPKFTITKSPSASSLEGLSVKEKEDRTYHTLNLPLRSILKHSPANGETKKSASFSDLAAGIDKHYRKKSMQSHESIVEDIPYILNQQRRETKYILKDRFNPDKFDDVKELFKGSIQSFAKHVKLPPEPVKVKNLPIEKQEAWEEDQLAKVIDWEGCQIDPSPFQLVGRTSLHKVHSLFSLLGLNHAYVTNTGRLIGVVALKELRQAIQGHLDAQEQNKGKVHTSAEEEDTEDEYFEDPQQLTREDTPDGYTLVNRASLASYKLGEDEEEQADSMV